MGVQRLFAAFALLYTLSKGCSYPPQFYPRNSGLYGSSSPRFSVTTYELSGDALPDMLSVHIGGATVFTFLLGHDRRNGKIDSVSIGYCVNDQFSIHSIVDGTHNKLRTNDCS